MGARTLPHRSLQGILTGTLATFACAGLAAVIASASGRPVVALVANTAAFLAVGCMTMRLRQEASVLEPAFGAGSAVLVFGVIQIAFEPAVRRDLGWRQLGTSLLVSVAFAISFACLGALLTTGGRLRLPPERRSAPPIEPAPLAERAPKG